MTRRSLISACVAAAAAIVLPARWLLAARVPAPMATVSIRFKLGELVLVRIDPPARSPGVWNCTVMKSVGLWLPVDDERGTVALIDAGTCLIGNHVVAARLLIDDKPTSHFISSSWPPTCDEPEST